MRGGAENTTLSPASGSTAASSYGTMRVVACKDSHAAQVIWNGNSTTATAGEYFFTLPDDYKPAFNGTFPITRAVVSGPSVGGYMEPRTDGRVKLVLTAQNYTYGSATYILA